MTHDVAIVGGGPAGSTVASLLKKYAPRLDVGIYERETFPRDHVGESQLPVIGQVLNEMGAWEKVEAAGFPIKVGATYRWGRTRDLWDFEFVPNGELAPQHRPAPYDGQRTLTAFQVDRAVYDDVLLRHAASLGTRVREGVAVRKVETEGDRIERLILGDGGEVTARWYVDASGHGGVLRRALGIATDSPTTLQNIAIWDYWRNAEWATTIGIGGTRVQVMSLGYGWLWFIPIGPDRTSVGLIVPADYYRTAGKKPRELYDEAIAAEPRVAGFLRNATREDALATTKDWSFLAERLAGENWFLAGESCGFADPILAAGMSLAHMGGREVAYTILALERRDHEPEWLKSRYSETHRTHIGHHIRFADYWYTHNGVFTDLQDHAAAIARSTGLDLSAQRAWQWLGTGGFINADEGSANVGGYGLHAAKAMMAAFEGEAAPAYGIAGATHLELDLEGAEKEWGVSLANGRIARHRVWRRDGKRIGQTGPFGYVIAMLKRGPMPFGALSQAALQHAVESGLDPSDPAALKDAWANFYLTLEAMHLDGWLRVSTVEGHPPAPPFEDESERFFHPHREAIRV